MHKKRKLKHLVNTFYEYHESVTLHDIKNTDKCNVPGRMNLNYLSKHNYIENISNIMDQSRLYKNIQIEKFSLHDLRLAEFTSYKGLDEGIISTFHDIAHYANRKNKLAYLSHKSNKSRWVNNARLINLIDDELECDIDETEDVCNDGW